MTQTMEAARTEGRAEAQATVVAGHEIVRRFGEGPTAVEALRGVSVEFARGSFTAIMGPSGSGKSTLMHILAGLDRPSDGWVELSGQRLDQLSDHDLTVLRRERIGFVFQTYNLLPVLTAEENITLPVRIGGGKPDSAWLGVLLHATGMEERRTHRPSELSGGEQQRVAVARALLSRPEVVFADEPTGNLDTKAGNEVLTLLRKAVDDYGQTTVMVTHDASAAATADEVLFLGDGEIVDRHRKPSIDDILDHLRTLA